MASSCLLIVRLLWRAISSGWRKCVWDCERKVCVFSAPGGQSPGVLGNFLSKYPCVIEELWVWSWVRACQCVHWCVRSFSLNNLQVLVYDRLCVCVFVHLGVLTCICVAGWHGAKVNSTLVSFLNTFLDLTGHVQACRNGNEVCVYLRVYLHLLQGEGRSRSIIHKSYCLFRAEPWFPRKKVIWCFPSERRGILFCICILFFRVASLEIMFFDVLFTRVAPTANQHHHFSSDQIVYRDHKTHATLGVTHPFFIPDQWVELMKLARLIHFVIDRILLKAGSYYTVSLLSNMGSFSFLGWHK